MDGNLYEGICVLVVAVGGFVCKVWVVWEGGGEREGRGGRQRGRGERFSFFFWNICLVGWGGGVCLLCVWL